jgi:hypothetical protein
VIAVAQKPVNHLCHANHPLLSNHPFHANL